MVKVIKTQCYLTTGYAVNRNVSIEMKIIQGVISRTMSHANHLAKETLFAIMLYGVMVAHKNLTLAILVQFQLGQFVTSSYTLYEGGQTTWSTMKGTSQR